ncbi:MAG: amidase [Rhizobiaceae bacterium]
MVEDHRPLSRSYLRHTAAFRDGADTPRDFLERCLAVVDERERDVRAFVTMDAAAARRAADASTTRWRAGRALSPIDGMPVGVKDIIETADMPTQMGSPLFAGWRSHRDAASVAALRHAGAVMLGKTVTTEFAAQEARETRNPHDLRRTPGGSSSGSAAAVACGMVSAALGTQVVGSIVRPASYCGCIGFKPGAGSLNRGGSHDHLSHSCLGVLAGGMADCWQVAFEIAVRVGGDPGHPALRGPSAVPSPSRPGRLAILRTEGWATAPARARQVFETACGRLRQARIECVASEEDDRLGVVEDALTGALRLTLDIVDRESLWPLNTYRDRDSGGLSRAMLERLSRAEAMTADDYDLLLARRDRLRALYAGLAATYDAAVTLSANDCAPLGMDSTGDPSFAVPGSLLGVPAMSLPLLRAGGLPLGLQVLGFRGADAQLFAVAGSIVSCLGDDGPLSGQSYP